MAVYCVRADFGKYAQNFLDSGYVAIGWLHDENLEKISPDDDDVLHRLYKEYLPDASKMSRAQNVGQISRFLFDITKDDYIVTPGSSTDELYYGTIESEYYHFTEDDGCPYRHRKKVAWNKKPVSRSDLSIPLQNTLRSSLTVYYIKQENAFLEAIGVKEAEQIEEIDYENLVLERVLDLSAEEFEILVTELLSAIGFTATHIGKSGDGGIDAEGELDIYNMAKIDLKIQAKRYRTKSRINAKIVRDFRGTIPRDSQGAIITTCEFRKKAKEEANKPGYKRIGLIGGSKLVEILVDNYEKLPEEMKEKLRMKRILVPE
jgi:predicted Mrr-cat superfamily restriction endonuclease